MSTVPIENLHQAEALQVARQGIQQGQDRLDEASRGLSRVAPRLDRVAPEESGSEVVRDIVELTRAAKEIKVNARVATTAGSISKEVLNLGRRLDVEA